MSTVTDNAPTVDTATAVVAATVAPVGDKPNPPAGMVARKNKDGTYKRNEKGEYIYKTKGTRKKGKKAQYAVPSGGFTSSDVPNFSVQHAMLKEGDFQDPLHFREWKVKFYEQRVVEAQKEVETMKALGSTVEERKEASEEMKLLAAFEALVAKRKGAGKTSAVDRLTERMGQQLSDLMGG